MADAVRPDPDVIQQQVDALLRTLALHGYRVRTGHITIHLDRGRWMSIEPCPTLRPGRRADDLPGSPTPA